MDTLKFLFQTLYGNTQGLRHDANIVSHWNTTRLQSYITPLNISIHLLSSFHYKDRNIP